MSVIRVWTLASWDDEVASRLVTILSERASDRELDLVWGPGLRVTELKGDGEPNIVCGPGIRITREGNVVRVDQIQEEPVDGHTHDHHP